MSFFSSVRVAFATFGFVATAALASHASGLQIQETNCKVRPLEQGKSGETVRECKVRLVRVEASKPMARIGKTTVQHYGTRVVYMQPLVVRANVSLAAR